jgi:hypothetical protein
MGLDHSAREFDYIASESDCRAGESHHCASKSDSQGFLINSGNKFLTKIVFYLCTIKDIF